MANTGKKKSYVKVGAMLQKKENDVQGRASYYLKIEKDTVVTINGVKVDALNIERPTDKFERMVKAGKMTEEQYDEKIAEYEKDGKLSFVKFELTAALDK